MKKIITRMSLGLMLGLLMVQGIQAITKAQIAAKYQGWTYNQLVQAFGALPGTTINPTVSTPSFINFNVESWQDASIGSSTAFNDYAIYGDAWHTGRNILIPNTISASQWAIGVTFVFVGIDATNEIINNNNISVLPYYFPQDYVIFVFSQENGEQILNSPYLLSPLNVSTGSYTGSAALADMDITVGCDGLKKPITKQYPFALGVKYIG